METAVRISVIAVIAAICSVIVKKQVQEFGTALAVITGIVILSFVISELDRILRMMDELSEAASLSPALIAPVIKTAGIAITTKVSAEICRDAKEGGIAAFLETAGAILALSLALPLFRTLLQTMISLM